MPYGIKDETEEQTEWMEGCVGSITGTNKRTDKPYTKSEKIAICKVQLKKTGASLAVSEESMREKFWDFEDKLREALRASSPYRGNWSDGPWIDDIFEDYVIVDLDSKLYKLPYTMDEDDVSFDWAKSVEVDRKTVYEPVAAEQEVAIKVPRTLRDGGRRVTVGGRTIN